jgi:sugar/nucleoside kinase (ribokinase family)
MKKLNLVSFEDATSDTFMYINDASISCKLDSKKIYLELLYGDKIPVDEYAHEVGGNAANVAAGVAAFGLSTAVFGTIGGDSRGKDILRLLKERKVETKYLKPINGASSNISVIITYRSERTILTHHPKRGSNMDPLPTADWYYLSQTQNPKLYDTICTKATKTDIKLAFNPGARMIKRDKPTLRKLLEKTDLLFVNKEEAAEILEIKRGVGTAYIKKLLRTLYSMSRGDIVITDGPKGAYAYDANKYYFIKPFPSTRTEPTGAGDSFASGVISAILNKNSLQDGLVWGSMNSAHVIRKIGSQVGLLTKAKVTTLRNKNPRYKTKTV